MASVEYRGEAIQAWDGVDVAALLEQAQTQQATWLRRELDRIHDQLEQRDVLHADLVDELEWKLDWYTDRLEELYSRGTGRRDGTRERLQNRIEQFYQELREERRQHWQDRQRLEEERREILRELDEATSDYLVDGVLDDHSE